MPKCSSCGRIVSEDGLITAWNYRGKMKKVCKECYYKR